MIIIVIVINQVIAIKQNNNRNASRPSHRSSIPVSRLGIYLLGFGTQDFERYPASTLGFAQ